MSSLLHLLVETAVPAGRPSGALEGDTRTAAEAAAVEYIREYGRRQAAHHSWVHVRVITSTSVRPWGVTWP
ncbi:hypothetical protein ACFY1J_27765 [Streptomyces sp. NPDC001406]|uniref:hypothetical protein n=1 Tax=Streptomyces sp. NPDC001406 TaxID=3364572 RepID=UPI0036CFC9A8